MIEAVLFVILAQSAMGVLVSAIAIDAITAARSGNLLDNSPRGYAHFNAFRLIGRLFHTPEPDLGLASADSSLPLGSVSPSTSHARSRGRSSD